ncbi:MAG: phosphomethylpyrimidine synthase ThiC [Kiritimatiellae bacterium]|nr:phosphomethylpyrimidine synthase ThiC [Kiritimatiellia bacterium]
MSERTLLESARAGETPPEVFEVARNEGRSAEEIRTGLAMGRIVIPANRRHTHLQPVGVGRTLRTKVNANIGSSPLAGSLEGEIAKLQVALEAGADAVMDLSTGPESARIRRELLARCPKPFGTVPLYEAAAAADDPADLEPEDWLRTIERHAADGVDFMTVHAGLLRAHIPLARRRLVGIVSRGGGLLAHWMSRRREENPLYTRFEDVLAICRTYEVTLSLGDGLRPGCLADASDEAQMAELTVLGELVRRARNAGVQAMVEGPGHIPLDQIEFNMRRERELCDDAPFYVLGPVVADCAAGRDHIAAAIGGAWAALHGAAMLCYVTPAEHLGLPDADDVREGVAVFRLAAHAADTALRRPGARERDDAMSRARHRFDWPEQFRLSLDPPRARAVWERTRAAAGLPPEPGAAEPCTMCGPKFCPMRGAGIVTGE